MGGAGVRVGDVGLGLPGGAGVDALAFEAGLLLGAGDVDAADVEHDAQGQGPAVFEAGDDACFDEGLGAARFERADT